MEFEEQPSRNNREHIFFTLNLQNELKNHLHFAEKQLTFDDENTVSVCLCVQCVYILNRQPNPKLVCVK